MSPLESFHRTSTAAAAPARVGPYRLVRELGRGGMGAVFLAERDDDEYRAKVAIKLVRPGMDTEFILARFRRERQTLARLQHPNISRLLDGGTTDEGLPYIVMEYIDGPWITTYAAQHKLGVEARRAALSGCLLGGRLRASQLHRPSRPEARQHPGRWREACPSSLDFGICKLLVESVTGANDTVAAAADAELCEPRADSRGGGHDFVGHLLARRSALRAADWHLSTPLREPDAARRSNELSSVPIVRPSAAVGEARASRASSPATWTTSSCARSTPSPRADTSRPRSLQTTATASGAPAGPGQAAHGRLSAPHVRAPPSRIDGRRRGGRSRR